MVTVSSAVSPDQVRAGGSSVTAVPVPATSTESSPYSAWTANWESVSAILPSGPTSMTSAPEARMNSSSRGPQSSTLVSASRSSRASTCRDRASLTTEV